MLLSLFIKNSFGFAIRSSIIPKRINSKFFSTVQNGCDYDKQELPANFNSDFMNVMRKRGYLHQCTDYRGLDQHFSNNTVSAYLGFDATAPSLHVGSLLQIMILRRLQKSGHKPIILLGGGTTKVGDPSGKDESRQLMSSEQIQNNIDSLSHVFKKFIKFGDGPTDAEIVNNADWLDSLNYLNFLRDYGKHFTINRMLSLESVKVRLEREQPLTFLEFNYMILQAYDFLELSRRQKVTVQIGGSDQWGNIVNGIELSRKVDQRVLFGLTAPLVTTSEGKKMGKTASGAVWLNKNMLSEFEYWQFWRNTADDDVIRFLKLFTDVPEDQIEEYKKLSGSELNSIKVILADEATKLLHGEDCLSSIHTTAKSLFSSGGGLNLDSIAKYSINQLKLDEKISVVDLLKIAQFVSSKSEGRRLIKGGGARVNDKKVELEDASVSLSDFDSQGRLKLSAGKKTHVLIVMKEV